MSPMAIQSFFWDTNAHRIIENKKMKSYDASLGLDIMLFPCLKFSGLILRATAPPSQRHRLNSIGLPCVCPCRKTDGDRNRSRHFTPLVEWKKIHLQKGKMSPENPIKIQAPVQLQRGIHSRKPNGRQDYRVRLYSYSLLVFCEIQSTTAESIRATLCDTFA